MVERHLSQHSNYGLTTLFLENGIDSTDVLFGENSDLANGVDLDIIRQGEDIVKYRDKDGNERTEKTRRFYKIPSWSYCVNAMKQNGIIRLNFSIPKYLYGHNLNLFPNKDYFRELSADPLYSRKASKYVSDLDYFSYISLCKFVDDFTLKTFGISSAYFRPEVLQLDISYNYRFSSEASKERYKQNVKDYFNRYHGRSFRTVRAFQNYRDEDFMKVTKQYSLKIYDKTKEFQEHDYEHWKKYLNDPRMKLSRGYIDDMLSGLTSFSGNLMRCEIAIRKTEFKEMFFRNIKDFTHRRRNEYIQKKPYYDKVKATMRGLVLIRSYLNEDYHHYDFRYNTLTGQYDMKPVGCVAKRDLDVRKMRVVRRFIGKYGYYLNYNRASKERCFTPIAGDYMTNDESVYDFLDEVIRFVIVRSEDDSTVNLCLIAKNYREQYLSVREIEQGARFFLTPGKSGGGMTSSWTAVSCASATRS